MQLDSLPAILIFVQVAEANSFSEAARRLGITPSGASKAVGRFESKLGVRLFTRTTRRLQLTEDGAALLDMCRHVLSQIEDAEIALANRRGKPAGRLLLQAPVAFGRLVVAPLLDELAAEYPELVIDVNFNDRRTDPIDDEFDLLIRIGELPQARLVARRIYDMRYVTVAAPSYVARHGEPRKPGELAQHRCLPYFDPNTRQYRPWTFVEDGQPVTVALSGHLNFNNAEALLEAAARGQGITTVARFAAARALAAGSVVPVLQAFMPPALPIHLLYPERRYLSPRVRAVVDYLSAKVPALVA